MIEWNRIDAGVGEPLILLHGAGSSSRSWQPVIDRLAQDRRVIAFDFPGFGQTPAVPGMAFTIEWAVAEIADQLARLGIQGPVDIVGNSMGGWVALEAAKQGVARSVVAIGPAGLWGPAGMPRLTQWYFYALIAIAPLIRTPARRLLQIRAFKSAVLSIGMKRPEKVPYFEALSMLADAYVSTPTLSKAVKAANRMWFEGGEEIRVPITLAFGSHDRFLPARNSRKDDHLPAHSRWTTLPNCGHVPMWDDPEAIVRTIHLGVGTQGAEGVSA